MDVSYIYVVESFGWAKIGISENDIKKRIRQYYSHNPNIKELCIFKIKSEIEIKNIENAIIKIISRKGFERQLDWFYIHNENIENFLIDCLSQINGIIYEKYLHQDDSLIVNKTLYENYSNYVNKALQILFFEDNKLIEKQNIINKYIYESLMFSVNDKINIKLKLNEYDKIKIKDLK
jgi:hypothetical protein